MEDNKNKVLKEQSDYDESCLKNVKFTLKSQDSSQQDDDYKSKLLISRLNSIFTEYMLSEVQSLAAFKFIKDKVGDKECKDVDNLRKWVIMKINMRTYPDYINKLQLGCPDIVPGLTMKAWWDPNQFGWVQELLKNIEVIKEELIELKANSGFQPYKSPSFANENNKSSDKMGSYANDSGQWNVFYLYLHNMKFEENCKKCPKTVDLIEKLVPRQYHHAFFSAVTPGTHIVAHNGPTNRKLRMHLPLMNVDGAKLRAGDETKDLKEGVPVIFDDSFNHESWHHGDKTRINLILDFWHPDLSDSEVKFFKMLQQSRLRHGKKILEDLGKGAEDDNFFDIIEKSKEILKNNDWWVG